MAHPIRIMTANLWNGRAEPAALDEALTVLDPDVLAVQELAPNAAAVIERRLPHGHLDPRTDYQGLGIAARYPVAVERLELPVRSGWRALLDPADWPEFGRPLEVLCAHLLNPIEFPWRRHVQTRTAQIDGILDAVGQRRTEAVVLVGDMNASPAWPGYRRLARHLQDAARVAGTAARTWSPWWWAPRVLRIDHAFVSGLQPLATHAHRIRGSDHSALVVDLAV